MDRIKIKQVDLLRAYHIVIRDKQPPEELANHITNVIKKPRIIEMSAEDLTQKSHRAAHMNKSTMIDTLAMELFVIQHPSIQTVRDTQFDPCRLPMAPNEIVLEVGLLEESQPDLCMGYVGTKTANGDDVMSPFRHWEETALIANALTPAVHFPFLTSRWISQDEPLSSAHYQDALDGACIVKYLHTFYTTTTGNEPSVVETCHFSLTTNGDIAVLWVHWREEDSGVPIYHMSPVHRAFVESVKLDGVDTDMDVLRKMEYNIADFALGQRLDKLKEATGELYKQRVGSARQGNQATATQGSGGGSRMLQLPAPPRSQKRQRSSN